MIRDRWLISAALIGVLALLLLPSDALYNSLKMLRLLPHNLDGVDQALHEARLRGACEHAVLTVLLTCVVGFAYRFRSLRSPVRDTSILFCVLLLPLWLMISSTWGMFRPSMVFANTPIWWLMGDCFIWVSIIPLFLKSVHDARRVNALFLRSFKADRPESLPRVLRKVLRRVGRVEALRAPMSLTADDRSWSLIGSEEKWRSGVRRLLKRVDLVIVDCSEVTENLEWEVSQLADCPSLPSIVIRRSDSEDYRNVHLPSPPIIYTDIGSRSFALALDEELQGMWDRIVARRPKLSIKWIRRKAKEKPMLTAVIGYMALFVLYLAVAAHERSEWKKRAAQLRDWDSCLSGVVQEHEWDFKRLDSMVMQGQHERATRLWRTTGEIISERARARFESMHGTKEWLAFCKFFRLSHDLNLGDTCELDRYISEVEGNRSNAFLFFGAKYYMLFHVSRDCLWMRRTAELQNERYFSPPSVLGL